MKSFLIHFGSAVLGILIITIPYMLAVSICNKWHSFFTFIFFILFLVDYIAVATVIDNMGQDGDKDD